MPNKLYLRKINADMRFFLIIIALAFSKVCDAQSYAVSLIPDSLMENVNVVKREELIYVTIKSPSKATVKRKYAVTILNEKGDNYATYFNSYSKLISLSDITGKLYDAQGKLIKSIKKKDIADMSMGDDMSLLTDDRSKSFSFYQKIYPYTVEFEDEQVYDGIFHLPKWFPIYDDKMSVIYSKFIVEVPETYQLRYKQFNYPDEPIITKGKTISYLWEIKGQKPFVNEILRPSLREIIPAVHIAPSEFEIGEYKGNMSTWKSFGLFINQLNSGRSELPDAVKMKVKEIADSYTTVKEKVEALYTYLQKSTRYIGIQLGIGSWQPFDAKYVAANKYGDCKALSNYMVSLLKAAGIKANYVLIDAGEDYRELIEEFPSTSFNHVIACVPNGKDTIWLECTDQTKALGYMGTFTGSRKALLIDEDGGHVVSTPYYKPSDNQQLRKVVATIEQNGTLKAHVLTKFTGEQQELQHSLMHDATEEERKKYLNRVISLPTYKVTTSNYTEKRTSLPEITEELEIEAPEFTAVSGKRLFVTPNLFNKSGTKIPDVIVRKYPLVFRSNYLDIDTVLITVPNEYTLESVPKSIELKNDFGDYSIRFEVKDNQLEMIRKYVRTKKVLAPEKYGDVQKFFDAVRRADNGRVVFVKKD
jgi:hypothetical protein